MQIRNTLIIAAATLALLAIAAGAVSADTLNGGGGNDRLTGGSGRSTISGGGGADVLYGDPVAGMGKPRKFQRLSVTQTGKQGSGPSTLVSGGNGRKVLFTSNSPEFLPSGPSSPVNQIYMKDLVNGRLTLITTDGGGGPLPIHPTYVAAISPNGRYVALSTRLGGYTHEQLFLKDLKTNTYTLLSRPLQGTEGNGLSRDPVFSPDSSMIAFASFASDLVPNDLNGKSDVFVVRLTDPAPRKVYLASVAEDGSRATGGNSSVPFFSPDGKTLGFESEAVLLLGASSFDGNAGSDVFLKSLTAFKDDRTISGEVRLISTNGMGVHLTEGQSSSGVFSPDGREVAFLSSAKLILPDTTQYNDIYIKTVKAGGPREVGTVRRVSLNAAGEQLDGNFEYPIAFSPDGTRLAFVTTAKNVVLPNFETIQSRLVIKDLTAANGKGAISLVAGDDDPQNNGSLGPLQFIDHGSRLVFGSYTRNLVGKDTNGEEDVFVATLAASVGRADVIRGGKGKDVIIGGPGPDVLVGGPGADRFVYLSKADSPRRAGKRDTIRDFNARQGDIIDLSVIDANTKKAGNQAFKFIGSKPFDGKPGRLRFSGGVLSGDVNGNRKADIAINVRVTGGKLTGKSIVK